MQIPRSGSSLVRLLGYLVAGFAALNFVQYYIWKIKYSAPADMGIVLGSGAIAICGGVTLVVANCLRDLEERVRRLESAQETKNRHG
jgi:hypothetical protein